MRVVLASLCLIAFAAPAAAQQQAGTPEALTQVYACAAQTEAAARLACYDAAVGRLQTELTSGNLVAVDRAQIESIERDSFGFSLPSLPNVFRRNEAAETVAETAMIVERVARNGEGRSVFFMTNGQTWAQIESTNSRRVRPGGSVTIRRAALGSYMLAPEGGGPPLRVRRVE